MQCLNCNTSLSESHRYCSACGNKVIRKRLTLKNIIEDFNQQFFNYDNKLLITFWHLIRKPEVVIDGFIHGNRRKYVNVIGYLALSLTLAGFQIYLMQKFFPQSMEGPQPPEALDPNIEHTINLGAEHVFDYFGIIVILSIPLAALGTYLVLIRNKHNYAEHIVFNMYVTAQYSIIMFFLTLFALIFNYNSLNILLIVTIVSYIYVGYALKKVYTLSIFGTIWRTLVSQMIYMSIVGTIMALVILILFIVVNS